MVRNTLVPLVLVESVLVAAYMFSNHVIRDANLSYIYRKADSELQLAAQREAEVVRQQLLSLTRSIEIFRTATAEALSTPPPQSHDLEAQNFRSEDGVLYSVKNNGGAASFYSARTPDSQKNLKKVRQLSVLDPMMKVIKDSNPLISQVYFNSWDSYNRIYPWIDSLKQFPRDMDIPAYNFYYQADAMHDPLRMPDWTEVYIDPAGGGWMTSCIAPVYRQNFLEGVVGFDVQIKSIIERIQKLAIPWGGYAILVSADGMIMAMPPAAESDFGLKELTDYSYQDAIRKEIFKPERFNFYHRHEEIIPLLQNNMEGNGMITLNGRQKLMAWETIPETWWKLITIVDKHKVDRETTSLAEHFEHIGYLMIAGLVLFYICFITYLWWRSRRASLLISEPLRHMNEMVQRISQEEYSQEKPHFQIDELEDTARSIVVMAERIQQITTDLRSAKTEAEQANKAKNLFLSSMSHELRTPLNAILGFSQILHGDQQLSVAERSKYASEILAAGQHLLSLIDDVLNLSRIETNQAGPLKIEVIDAIAICEECCDMLYHLADEKKLSLTTNFPEGGVHLKADRTRLRQIIINLLTNAIKYNHLYGWVQLSVVRMTESNQVKISVHDTGNGIHEDRQHEIFEPFNRLGYETSGIHGTGIGLSISKQLVEAMQGHIGFESVWKEGSLFWITLPASEEALPAEPEIPADSPYAESYALEQNMPHRVIMLGCSQTFQNRMQRLARGSRLRFIPYTDDETLMAAIGTESGMDLFMVNIDHPEQVDCLQHLRTRVRFHFTSIIAITSDPQRLDDEVSGNLFYDYVLLAPLDELHVLSVIHKLINLATKPLIDSL